jgi:hypothetical protein
MVKKKQRYEGTWSMGQECVIRSERIKTQDESTQKILLACSRNVAGSEALDVAAISFGNSI